MNKTDTKYKELKVKSFSQFDCHYIFLPKKEKEKEEDGYYIISS